MKSINSEWLTIQGIIKMNFTGVPNTPSGVRYYLMARGLFEHPTKSRPGTPSGRDSIRGRYPREYHASIFPKQLRSRPLEDSVRDVLGLAMDMDVSDVVAMGVACFSELFDTPDMADGRHQDAIDGAAKVLSLLSQRLKERQKQTAAQALSMDERSGVWLTVSEIHERQFEGLPKSRAKLVEYLDIHGLTGDPYLCRKREGTGRSLEYRREAFSRMAIQMRGDLPEQEDKVNHVQQS